MTKHKGIPDLLVYPLENRVQESQEVSRMLSFDDHILRRFGLLELVRKFPGELNTLNLRSVADEIWFLLEGTIMLVARDVRSGSPSEGVEIQLEINEPARVMVPFGVAFGWSAIASPALMLRCTTHPDGEHDEDKVIPIGSSE